jgi:hypothetical protein
MKFRTWLRAIVLLVLLVVVATSAAVVFLRRKKAADVAAPVQLGAREGLSVDLSADDPGVAAIQAAAAQVRGAFQGI